MGKRILPLMILVSILCIVVMVFLLVGDFGGFYWETGSAYARTRTWEYLNIGHPISGPFLGIQVLLLTALLILMVLGMFIKKLGSGRGIYIASIILVSLVFILATIGGIAVLISGITGDYDDWWFDESFYAGMSGPLLIMVPLIIMAIKGGKTSSLEE